MLVHGQLVLTQNNVYGPGGVIEDGAVLVSGAEIAEVGRYSDLKAAYPTASIVGSTDFWVMPGLVNAHQHGSGLTGFQLGGLDDCFEIWRLGTRPQARVTDPYINVLYACQKMIEAGITTCIHYNTSSSPELHERDAREQIRAYADAGIRVSFGIDIRNRNHLAYGDEEFLAQLPMPLKHEAQERASKSRTLEPEAYFRLVARLSDELAREERIRLSLTPAGPQWCTEDVLRRIKRESDERGIGVQMHVLETRYQRSYFARAYGKTAVQWLDEIEFLGPRVSLAHAVWLSRDDMNIVALREASVVHNPSSNLRLRSGIAPLPLFYEAGVLLGIGLDGNALNDDFDLFQEMRLAANLQRVPGVDRHLAPVEHIFRMANAGGAQALGWGDRAGTLEPGKRADLILMDMRSSHEPYLAAHQNPVDRLVYRGRCANIDTVMVDGEILYQGKRHVRLNPDSVIQELRSKIAPPASADPFNEQILPHIVRYYSCWDNDELTPFHGVNSIY
jgi:cytosine/adenosine deaminase-related metal-dependent hydrolase